MLRGEKEIFSYLRAITALPGRIFQDREIELRAFDYVKGISDKRSNYLAVVLLSALCLFREIMNVWNAFL